MLPGADFLLFAHRGASAERPENTLPAFARAIELGADGIELDVHCCEDALVVIHDDSLERTTSGRGSVADSSLEIVRSADAGDGAAVPLLTEVLDALEGTSMLLNVELKGAATAVPAIALLRDRGVAPEGILLSAFDHNELVRAQANAPEFPRGALFGRLPSDPVARARAVGATTANFALRTVTRSLVEDCRAAGLAVLFYPVNATDDAEALREMGVRGIFTDDPARMLAHYGRC